VHRLDKETSGALLLAKTPRAQAALGHAFESREVTKLYLAVTDAVPAQREAVIEAPIGRDPADRTRMAILRRGRAARTGYSVLGHDGRKALLLVRLYTGRTHQVRVHLAAIGAPVHGDRVYGAASDGRQLLHAWRIVVPHPEGGTLEVTAPAPPDVLAAVRGMGLEAVASEYGSASPARRESSPGTPSAP
jgi:23S rRNA pseudouridine1911/1915/1917 synthase